MVADAKLADMRENAITHARKARINLLSTPTTESAHEDRPTEEDEEERLTDETVIWRFMSVAKLVSMFNTSSLHFACLSSFEDPHEADFGGLLSSPNNIMDNWFAEIRAKTFANCWYEYVIESDAHWRLYTQKEETVAVASTVGQLRNELQSERRWPVKVARVRYLLPRAILDSPPYFVTPFPYLTKRAAFAHEHEIRAVMPPNDITGDWDILRAPSGPQRGAPETFQMEESRRVLVDLPGLVNQVIVSPYASDWLLPTIRGLILKFGLPIPANFSQLRAT